MSKRNLLRNTLIFQDYYARLKNIALSIFKWDGLPDTCNERFLEECLFNYGQAIFVDDSDIGFLNLKTTPASTVNVYDEPTAFTAYSTGYNKIFSADDCVYIRNNYLAKSTDSTILMYAEKLATLDRAIQVNTNAQKTPILIRCDDKTKRTLEAVYSQYSGDSPVIFGHKSLQEKPLEALKTEAPFVADKLREEKRAVWNEVLEFLGLNTNPSDKKKERLIVTEVDSNNEQTHIQAETMLLCRQKACEEINKKYKLNVSVKLRVKEETEELKPAEEVVA